MCSDRDNLLEVLVLHMKTRHLPVDQADKPLVLGLAVRLLPLLGDLPARRAAAHQTLGQHLPQLLIARLQLGLDCPALDLHLRAEIGSELLLREAERLSLFGRQPEKRL